jgi:hypothetical protein
MNPKFRNGDIVKSWVNMKYRVLRSYGKNGKIFYECEDCFSKAKEHYEESELEFHYKDLKSNKEDFVPETPNCPRCKNPWSITGFGKKRWYDCSTCKDSAENICNRDEPPKFDWSRIAKGYRDDDDIF